MTGCYSVNTQFSLKRQHGSSQVAFLKIFSKMTLCYSVNTHLSLKRQHGSNQVVHF